MWVQIVVPVQSTNGFIGSSLDCIQWDHWIHSKSNESTQRTMTHFVIPNVMQILQILFAENHVKREREGGKLFISKTCLPIQNCLLHGTCIGTLNWSVEEKITVWWMRWCTIVPNSYQTRTQHDHPSLGKCRIYTNQDHQLQEVVIMLFEYVITFEYGGRF
jgi:hypothetical protein